MKSKFLGCLLGAALGDALGASFEGRRPGPSKIQALLEGKGLLRYTDDTHMMIGVAESLIACRGFDGQHMAQTFTHNFEREPWRGYGPGPPRVFRLIKSGQPWDQASKLIYPGGSFGNGAAMRIAPVGLLYFDDPPRLREVAYLSSQITHAHPLGKEGAALQAYAVALATRSEPSSPLDLDAFLERLKGFCQEELYHRKLRKVGKLLEGASVEQVVQELGHGVEAPNSVPTAIYCFLKHPDSFEEAVAYAIGLGGDTDTIGSMTGALSGARLGLGSIPEPWRARLENRVYLEELALRLYEVSQRRRPKMEVMEAVKGRRSIRKFKLDPVGEELLERVLEAGRWAPSWANTQCWRFIIVRSPEVKARLAQAIPLSNRARPSLETAPVVIAICAERGKAGWRRGELATDKGDWFMFDTGLACQNLMLAAHSLGLGTVAIGLFDAQKAAEVLEVPENVAVVLLLPLGWPDEEPQAPPRRSLSELCFAEKFGQPLWLSNCSD